jgi:heterodisulfide reductase subunit A-like polyferredoxin
MLTKSLEKALKVKKNLVYLRRLFFLPKGEGKVNRLKALRNGSAKQRRLVVVLLHYVISGQIPLRREHFPLISKKMTFLNGHFRKHEDMQRLLKSTDAEIKEVLGKVTNFHVLFHCIFK